MRRALVVILVSCTPSVAPQPRIDVDVDAPLEDDRQTPLALQPGELVRLRTIYGSCFHHRVLAVREDGRAVSTLREGCRVTALRGPPISHAPKVRGTTLSPAALAELRDLVADPNLARVPEQSINPNPGSFHGSFHTLVVRTPTGDVQTRYDLVPREIQQLDGRLRELASQL